MSTKPETEQWERDLAADTPKTTIVPPTPLNASPGGIPDAYTEADITILAPEQAVERFDFALKADLGRRYPASHPDFISRLIDTCRIIGQDIDPVIARYLAKRPDAPPPSPELLAAFAEQRL